MLGLGNFITHPPAQLSSVGYPSAFQGPRVAFYGAELNGQHAKVTPNTVLSFNPDGRNVGLPEVDAEMTTVFLPEQSVSFAGFPSYDAPVPATWSQNLGLYANGWNGQSPEAEYPWNVTDSSGQSYMVYMAQYRMKYYVAFSSSWTGAEAPVPAAIPFVHTSAQNVYNNLNIWFEIDTTPTWYIQGGGTAFFAIAKVQLGENVEMDGIDNHGNAVPARTDESTIPEHQPSVLMIYYSAFGGTPASVTPNDFQGSLLNPNYFRNTTFFSVNLQNFGVSTDFDGLATLTVHGDTATFCFDVTVFVFGQYLVQDIQKDPTQYGRFTPTSTWNFGGLLGDIWNWISNPLVWGSLLTIGIFVLILIFAPWLLLVIIMALTGRRRR